MIDYDTAGRIAVGVLEIWVIAIPLLVCIQWFRRILT